MTWSRAMLGVVLVMALGALVSCEGDMTDEQIESAREKALSDLDKPLEKMKIKVSDAGNVRRFSHPSGIRAQFRFSSGGNDDWATRRSFWACFPNAA